MPLCHCESGLTDPVLAEVAPCEVDLGVCVLAFPDLTHTVALGCLGLVSADQDFISMPQGCVPAGAGAAHGVSLPYGQIEPGSSIPTELFCQLNAAYGQDLPETVLG